MGRQAQSFLSFWSGQFVADFQQKTTSLGGRGGVYCTFHPLWYSAVGVPLVSQYSYLVSAQDQIVWVFSCLAPTKDQNIHRVTGNP